MFGNMKIRDRLVILLAALMLPMLLITYFGDRGMNIIQERLGIVYEHRTVPLAMLSTVNRDFGRVRSNNMLLMLAPSDEIRQEALKFTNDVRADTTREWQGFYTTLLTPEGKRLADASWSAMQDYFTTVDTSQRMVAANDHARLAQLSAGEWRDTFLKASKALDELSKFEEDQAADEYKRAGEQYSSTRTQNFAVAGIALLAGVILAGIAVSLLVAVLGPAANTIFFKAFG